MSEKPRRKKEQPGKTLRALALGAELLAGGAAAHAALNYEQPKHAERPDAHYKDFRRSESVSERYGQTDESILLGQKYADLEPELPINDDALNSSLASEAGIHAIKSPAEIMRERKARAEVLAKKAHEAWQRECAKKKKH